MREMNAITLMIQIHSETKIICIIYDKLIKTAENSRAYM